MSWIRWDTKTSRHRVVGHLAEALKVRKAEALGLYTAACLGFGLNQPDGRADQVSDTTLEDWAMWEGRRGRFAAAFRTYCVVRENEPDSRDQPGSVRGWWRQVALLQKRSRDAARPPSHLRHPPDSLPIPARESGGNTAGIERESRGKSAGDGRTEDGDGNGDELLPTSLPAGRLLQRLAFEPGRHAVQEFLEGLPPAQDRTHWEGVLLGCLDGLGTAGGQAATVAELAAACTDYRRTPPDQWGFPHFRGFVDRVMSKRGRHARSGRRGRADATVTTARTWAERES